MISTKAIKRISKGRPSISILRNVHLSRKNNQITIYVTDLDVWYKYTTESQGIDFACLVDVKLFTDTIGIKGLLDIKDPSGNALSVNGINLPITNNADDYPICMTTNNVSLLSGLSDALKPMLHSMSPDPTRYHLNGVYSDKDNLVSTDGHRCTVNNISLNLKHVIPDKAVNCIVDLKLDNVNYGELNGYHTLKTDIIELGYQSIKGTYPNYKQFIPNKYNKRVILKSDDLLKAIKELNPLINKKSHRLILTTLDNKLTLSLPDNDTTKTIELASYGEPIEFYINAKYLTEGLSLFKKDIVTLSFIDSNSPIKLSVNDKLKTIIMPLRK